MVSTSILVAIVAQLAALQLTVAIPLRVLGPQEGSPEQVKLVKDTATHAHTMIENVEKKLAGPDRQKHLNHAFGPGNNGAMIDNGVKALKEGKFKMDRAHDPAANGFGYYDPAKDKVAFGNAFFAPQTEKVRAGAMIHEASHAILKTTDVWHKDGNGHKAVGGAYTGVGQSGYHDSHWNELKKTNGAKMHENADSWRVLAHTCTYGFSEPLTRRALLEDDPVKRNALFRRAAKACAMPSKAQREKMTAAKKAKVPAAAGAKKATTPASKGKQTVVPKDKKLVKITAAAHAKTPAQAKKAEKKTATTSSSKKASAASKKTEKKAAAPSKKVAASPKKAAALKNAAASSKKAAAAPKKAAAPAKKVVTPHKAANTKKQSTPAPNAVKPKAVKKSEK